LLLTCLVLLLLGGGLAPTAIAAGDLPSYQLQYLGPGTPYAINNSGIVVGALLNGNNYAPLVSTGGAAWRSLPMLPGGVSSFPMDINDDGVIVGVSYDAGWIATAVRWTPAGSGYTVAALPKIAGDTSSYATGINNLGQIVGARGALGYTPTGSGWLYSDAGGLISLSTQYGLWVVPWDLNDNGLVLAGGEQLDLNTGVVSVLPPGPSNYQGITGRYLNNRGQIGGSAPQSSTSLNIVSVFRYTPGAGWLFIAGTSKYTTVSGLNAGGDVGYGEQGAGLYLEGQGAYALYTLLDPAVTAAGWTITGSSPKINDGRQVAVTGSNSATGQAGGVLLTPGGAVQPPTAPVNLQGQPHPATAAEPWNSIDLTWENTSPLTNSYELERREAGTTAWVQLALAVPPSASNTSHSDTTVGAGITYDYRVRAIGLAGPSPWSALATVTAPATPPDTIPPTVTITAPANGATVSGTVTVSAQATDNVGVTYLEISYWNQYTGQEVILGSAQNAGSLSVPWNTAGLTPEAYKVHATANDALGNWSRAEITVNVSGSPASVMKVTGIAMSGSVRGSTASISGTVTVKDGSGKAVSGAAVNVTWTIPGGTTRTASGKTTSNGTVRFSTSGPRGTYTLTVTNVTKSGMTWDKAGSVLSASITK
jgi:hypothetical protein